VHEVGHLAPQGHLGGSMEDVAAMLIKSIRMFPYYPVREEISPREQNYERGLSARQGLSPSRSHPHQNSATGGQNMSNEHFTRQVLPRDETIDHVSMQALASFVILLAMSPVLLVLVVVSMTYLLSALIAVSGILG